MTYAKPILATLVIALASLFSATTVYSSGLEDSMRMPMRGLTIQPGQLPSYYPPRFQASGSIFNINDDGKILVSGSAQPYTLSTNVRIHSMSTEFSSRRALRRRMEIGFSVDNSNHRTITEIWILPEGAIMPH